ncbi:MAG: SMC-Scp complex subunit ScpB [Firmicutes bacterium]|nr:SMC-Scp complex subunit ScpB [Bacillota bacterium]
MEMDSFESKKKVIEALLFIASRPLSAKELSEATDISPDEMKEILAGLSSDYESGGIHIKEWAGAWQMVTNPEVAEYIDRMNIYPERSTLSRASLETLAIIAYQQPITRNRIEEIRGVNVDKIITHLAQKKLIKEVGRAPVLGRPILYGTTREFLRYFGLNSLEELPPLEIAIAEKDEKEEETANETNAENETKPAVEDSKEA